MSAKEPIRNALKLIAASFEDGCYPKLLPGHHVLIEPNVHVTTQEAFIGIPIGAVVAGSTRFAPYLERLLKEDLKLSSFLIVQLVKQMGSRANPPPPVEEWGSAEWDFMLKTGIPIVASPKPQAQKLGKLVEVEAEAWFEGVIYAECFERTFRPGVADSGAKFSINALLTLSTSEDSANIVYFPPIRPVPGLPPPPPTRFWNHFAKEPKEKGKALENLGGPPTLSNKQRDDGVQIKPNAEIGPGMPRLIQLGDRQIYEYRVKLSTFTSDIRNQELNLGLHISIFAEASHDVTTEDNSVVVTLDHIQLALTPRYRPEEELPRYHPEEDLPKSKEAHAASTRSTPASAWTPDPEPRHPPDVPHGGPDA